MRSWWGGVIVTLAWIATSANAGESAPGDDVASAFERQVAQLKEQFAREHPGTIDDPEWVKARLQLLAAIDERGHDVLTGTARGTELLEAIDAQNGAELKSMVHRWGWIRSSEFGVSAAVHAWPIVMHAKDLAFQREVLEQLMQTEEKDWKAYAYLYDRIASNPLNASSHGLQRYGSQGQCVAGKWVPSAIEDPGKLDERRRAIGLSPHAEYVSDMTDILCTAEDEPGLRKTVEQRRSGLELRALADARSTSDACAAKISFRTRSSKISTRPRQARCGSMSATEFRLTHFG